MEHHLQVPPERWGLARSEFHAFVNEACARRRTALERDTFIVVAIIAERERERERERVVTSKCYFGRL